MYIDGFYTKIPIKMRHDLDLALSSFFPLFSPFLVDFFLVFTIWLSEKHLCIIVKKVQDANCGLQMRVVDGEEGVLKAKVDLELSATFTSRWCMTITATDALRSGCPG